MLNAISGVSSSPSRGGRPQGFPNGPQVLKEAHQHAPQNIRPSFAAPHERNRIAHRSGRSGSPDRLETSASSTPILRGMNVSKTPLTRHRAQFSEQGTPRQSPPDHLRHVIRIRSSGIGAVITFCAAAMSPIGDTAGFSVQGLAVTAEPSVLASNRSTTRRDLPPQLTSNASADNHREQAATA